MLALLYIFFRFTPLGLAMRAAAQNPVSSRLVGIRVGWMLALGWGLAAAVGAVAGMMVAPIVYLDPNMMSGILRTVNAESGVSMLLVEQNAAMALELADHACVIETGRVVISGPAAELKRDDAVRRAYLGY